MSREYYEEQWKRFRKSYDVKNKYHPIGQDHYFGDYKYEATQWHEKLLTKMHSTIKLEGRPRCKNLEELWSRIGSVPKNEVVRAVLRDEIENAESPSTTP